MEQLGLNFAVARQRCVVTVSELTILVRELLEGTFRDCWVSGEVSNCRRAPSGHFYFTLKDQAAQLKCVCFRQQALYLKVKPQDGLEIVARGRLSVYDARGEYQLYVETIEPRGYGALQLAFEQLKRKLAAEGLFDDDRKRSLPRLPRRIGLVTSPNGAAVADFLRILERRFHGLHVRLYPVQVQGEPAAGEIVRALRWFSESGWPDVVVVARGGGSLEDLWTFNEEVVARAIAECPVPVIAAVGHQTDFTIADFVADLRAPTPSAAAELATPEKAELAAAVSALRERAARALRYRISQTARRLAATGIERPAAALKRRLDRHAQHVDDLEFRLRDRLVGRLRTLERRLRDRQHRLAELDLRVRLADRRGRLGTLWQRLEPLIERRLGESRARIDTAAARLAALSPLRILERGYAIVTTPAGEILRAADQTAASEALDVRLHRGGLAVRVESTRRP